MSIRLDKYVVVNVFEQTVLERESAPYGKCQEYSDRKHNVYNEMYPVHYSSQVSVRKTKIVLCNIIIPPPVSETGL